MKHTLGILFMVLFSLHKSNAQQGVKVGELGYQVSFPSGKFADFTKRTSWSGFSLSGRKYLKQDSRFSYGASISWFYFNEKKGRQTVSLGENGTYTGEIRNYTNIYGLLLLAQYDFSESNKKIIPFIRGGIGGAAQYQHQNIGLFTANGEGIQFYFNVEAGVRLSQDKDKGINLSVTYNNMPGTSDIIHTQFWGLKLAVLFQK